jgi:hypothetical protein
MPKQRETEVFVVLARSVERGSPEPIIAGVYVEAVTADKASERYQTEHIATTQVLNGILYQPAEPKPAKRKKGR